MDPGSPEQLLLPDPNDRLSGTRPVRYTGRAPMRLAVLVASDYQTCPALPPAAAALVAARAVYDRLGRTDAGYEVEWLPGNRELPEELERLLAAQGAPPTSLLFYFAGHLVWQPGRAPALALESARPRAFPLSRVGALLERSAGEVLLLVDGTLPTGAEQRDAVASAVLEALAEYAPRSSCLVGVSPADGGWSAPFTDAVLRALDTSPASGDVYSSLHAETARLAATHACRTTLTQPLFSLLAPLRSVRPRPSAAPPSDAMGAAAARDAALAARAAWFTEQGDYAGLAETYEAMLETMRGAPAEEIARWLAAYHRTQRNDPWRALQLLEQVVAHGDTSVALRLELADQHAAAGQSGAALDHCLSALAHAPREVSAYRRLRELSLRMHQPDRAWAAAAALELCGGATSEEATHAATHRPAGLLPATATIETKDWQAGLAPPERFPALETVVELVSAAAIEHRIEVLRKQRKVPKLDPSTRQDPKTSTITLCRSLTWTARLLGVPAPELYVKASDEATMEALPLEQRTTLVSKAFASGLSLPELTFLWGRHLTYLRPDHYVLVFFRTFDEMTSLLMAAQLAASWDAAKARGVEAEEARLAAHLHRALGEPALAKLRVVTANLTRTRGRKRVQLFTEGLDRVANRAGLLACGDLSVAARMIERFPIATSAADPVSDLCVFSVSSAYAELRAALGVAIK